MELRGINIAYYRKGDKLMLKIAYSINIEEKETNEHYDSERCHNGGGYHQPCIVATLMSGMQMEIDDSSCGEFGSRVDIILRMGDHVFAECTHNSMDRMYYSTFDRNVELHRLAENLACHLGYGWAFVYEDELDDFYY